MIYVSLQSCLNYVLFVVQMPLRNLIKMLLCKTCREGLEGMWDVNKTPCVGLLSTFEEGRPSPQWEIEQGKIPCSPSKSR